MGNPERNSCHLYQAPLMSEARQKIKSQKNERYRIAAEFEKEKRLFVSRSLKSERDKLFFAGGKP